MPSIYPVPSKVRQGSRRCYDPTPQDLLDGSLTTCLPEELQRHLGIKSICANSRKWAICVLTNKLLPRFIRVTSGSLSSWGKYLVHLNSDLRNEPLGTHHLHFLLMVLLQENLTYCLCVSNTFIFKPIVCLWGGLKRFTSRVQAGLLSLSWGAKSVLHKFAEGSFITIRHV